LIAERKNDHLVLRPVRLGEMHARGGLDGGQKSGRRLIVWRMGATIPIGLCALAVA
jgi:hypothetical protein